MNRHAKKFLLLLLAAALLFGSGRLQQSLNHDRDTLGLTHAAVLENAPPALAFTTVALGGFRGLISNFLWIRLDDMQQDDKYFEAAQLADWITKLEPNYPQVWIFQAWNMAYNISVKFKENSQGNYADRWHWVEHGIELLRDEGLRYNPNSILIYRELGWFFQHKMGQNLDDGNRFYKQQWADEMEVFFGPNGTNFDQLLAPRTEEDFKQLQIFTNQYKLDPAFAKSLDAKYGPFDWRLSEAHAIYWGAKGLEEAAKHPDKVKTDDLMTLRRIIYQSMLQAVHHGRIMLDPLDHTRRVAFGPNLDLIPHLNAATDELYAEEADPGQKEGILRAHRNALRDEVYFLYEAGRTAEAQKWFNYLGENYPNRPIIENQPNSLPKNLTLEEYALAAIQIDIGETSQERVNAAVQGLLGQAYVALAAGEDDRYENLKRLATRVHQRYTAKNGGERTGLTPFNTMNAAVIRQLTDPQNGLPYAARAVLITQLRRSSVSPAVTNAPAGAGENISTNSISTNSISAPIP